MQRSEQINELAAALAKAQGEIKGAVKDSDNPFFKSKYADLASVWDSCRAALCKNGLSVAQCPHSETDEQGKYHLFIDTLLMHSSGQWLEQSFEIPLVKLDPQALGAATSYGRRYALAAMVGIYQEDADAEPAMKREPAAPKAASVAEVKPLPNADADWAVGIIEKTIRAIAADAGETYDTLKKPAAAFLKEEFGVSKRGDFGILKGGKLDDAVRGLWAAFGPKREPGMEPEEDSN